MKMTTTHQTVRDAYGRMAQQGSCGCGCGASEKETQEYAKNLGYSQEELEIIPTEANLALGCGNPTALANLREGEVVLDLGSGAGFDCFLAANQVGPSGQVIGVDMTSEMIEKARRNASKSGASNVEFRLGEIEHLPVADNSVDVVISNCVINLAPDKAKVFREIRRVLKPGGRVAISDVALLKDLPQAIRDNNEAYVRCIAGAILVEQYPGIIEAAGLQNVRVQVKGSSCLNPQTGDPLGQAIMKALETDESLQDYAVSVYLEAEK